MNGLRLSDIYKFAERPVESGWFRPALMGVHYSNGWVEATDAHILIREKYKYDSELEGKIIGRYGEEIDAEYPDCESVIPKFLSNKNYVSIHIDEKMLYDICRVLVILKCHYDSYTIKIGNCHFVPKRLEIIAAMCVRHECCTLYLSREPYGAAVVPLGYGVMVVMPVGEQEQFFDYGCHYVDHCIRRQSMQELHEKLLPFVAKLKEELAGLKIVRSYEMQKERKALVVKIGRFETCIRILEKYIGKNIMGGKINE